MATVTTNFYVILPSNTRVEGNRMGHFRVRHPKKLQFRSEWCVGLSVMSYPHSWPSIGTIEPQRITVRWRSGVESVVEVERTHRHAAPDELAGHLNACITHWWEGARARFMNDNAEDDEGGSRDNTWRSRYPKLDRYLRFSYDAASQRFHVFYKAELIERVSATEQLLYAMGFEARDGGTVDTNTYARYPPDLHGGVSSLYVYAPGLIEPVIVGDTTAPLLRIANVKGRPDDVVEDVYVAVQYHRLLVKEIAEIEIQIKTATNRICPFEYGNVILTLHFRKMPYF